MIVTNISNVTGTRDFLLRRRRRRADLKKGNKWTTQSSGNELYETLSHMETQMETLEGDSFLL